DTSDQPRLVEPDDELSSGLIPSLLFFGVDGSTQIGSRALASSGGFPDRTVRSIKRVMGYEEGVRIGERTYQPEEIAAHILGHLVAYAEEHLRSARGKQFDVRRAIVTVPANFFDLQIRAILDACEQAGLETDRDSARRAAQLLQKSLGHSFNSTIILDEPSAAALYFVHYLAEERSFEEELDEMVSREEGLRILVYDHGGGTLDISIAQAQRLEDGSVGIRILATRGANDLGGDHLDILLLRDLLSSAKSAAKKFDSRLITDPYREIQRRRAEEDWSDGDWAGVLRARQEWKRAAEEVKIALGGGELESTSRELPGWAVCHFEGGGLIRGSGAVTLEMAYGEMADRLREPLAKAGSLVEKALELAELEPEDIDFVLHAGRQSLLKLVQQRVAQIFARSPREGVATESAGRISSTRGRLLRNEGSVPHDEPNQSGSRVSSGAELGPGVGRIVREQKNLMKVCVAKGAVLHGRYLDAHRVPFRLIQEPRLPHSYGIDRPGAFGKLELEEILRRGEVYPLAREKALEKVPETGRLHLKLYQNTGTRIRIRGNQDIRQIGSLEHFFDPEATESLTLKLDLDASRLLTAEIGDQKVEIRPLPPSDELDWMG
ncbi:MAG: Hsp70 family protein, partial [Holophagales bacterium]|nr:Hsp70 family protein [Holophagales bacterium]